MEWIAFFTSAGQQGTSPEKKILSALTLLVIIPVDDFSRIKINEMCTTSLDYNLKKVNFRLSLISMSICYRILHVALIMERKPFLQFFISTCCYLLHDDDDKKWSI